MRFSAGAYWHSSDDPMLVAPLEPPAMSSLPPVRRSVAVCDERAASSPPVAAKVPDPGTYISAPASVLPLKPPATSTLPLGRSVAVWAERAALMAPVALKLPAYGL